MHCTNINVSQKYNGWSCRMQDLNKIGKIYNGGGGGRIKARVNESPQSIL